jgi:hypothetical protein
MPGRVASEGRQRDPGLVRRRFGRPPTDSDRGHAVHRRLPVTAGHDGIRRDRAVIALATVADCLSRARKQMFTFVCLAVTFVPPGHSPMAASSDFSPPPTHPRENTLHDRLLMCWPQAEPPRYLSTRPCDSRCRAGSASTECERRRLGQRPRARTRRVSHSRWRPGRQVRCVNALWDGEAVETN